MALSLPHSILQGTNTPQVIILLLSLTFLYALIHLARTYKKLSHIPGPFWSRLTNLPRVSWVRSKRAHEIHLALHEKHGEIVRFGPNMVSLSNPAWIPALYPARAGFPKSKFYKVLAPWTPSGGALPAVFSSTDENVHKNLKTPIASLYSMSKILPLEPFVDKTLDVLCQELDSRFVETKKVFDLADWLQFFAFDVMGTLTFSKRYGFLERGVDVGGVLGVIWGFLAGSAVFTQVPWFDKIWNKNVFMARFHKKAGPGILGIVGKYVAERQEAQSKKDDALSATDTTDKLRRRDMLDSFLEIQRSGGLPPWTVTAWTFSNILAGSDSTAVVIRTAFYNLLTHPAHLLKLRAELTSASASLPTGFSKPYPSYKEICDLPYLDAVVLEALRMHPPFALPFERVVPTGGISIGGEFFPEGTVLGMSAYVVNRHQGAFGEDAGVWNPERWMVEKEVKSRREAAVLTFGAGRRVCLGRHIAMLELKKIVPALVLRYDFEIQDAKRYQVENCWFFRQYGMDVTVKKRDCGL
ncbi:cytochrome P450 [Aspergillus karnatakaensis]|uniref:cytochrome P450 n=1 Tax=Aspergillus karnatakaensis TaxID=1810916 RepID=UPI003CCC9502